MICSFRWNASVIQLWSWWMRTRCVSLKIIPVMPTSSTVPMASVSRVSGLVMAPMTVGTILMKIGTTVVSIVSKSVSLDYSWGIAWKKMEYPYPLHFLDSDYSIYILTQQLTTPAAPVSFVARMVGASSPHGNVIMRMTVVMGQMRKVVNTHPVLMGSLPVPTIVVFPCHRSLLSYWIIVFALR